MIETKERVIFLDKIHLFSGLEQDQLAGIAVRLEEREVSAGTVIFKRHDKPDGFYMVYKGKVKVTVPNGEKGERQISVLYGGDYFGEEALFERRKPFRQCDRRRQQHVIVPLARRVRFPVEPV